MSTSQSDLVWGFGPAQVGRCWGSCGGIIFWVLSSAKFGRFPWFGSGGLPTWTEVVGLWSGCILQDCDLSLLGSVLPVVRETT